MTATNRVHSLNADGPLYWKNSAYTATFQSLRGFVVVNAEGTHAFKFNDSYDHPVAWNRKRDAQWYADTGAAQQVAAGRGRWERVWTDRNEAKAAS